MRTLKKIFKHGRSVPTLIATLLLIFVMAVSASVAWFVNRPLTPTGGEVIPGYFAGGDGTEANPYIINKPIHLYNLAWLQEMGRFNEPNSDGTYTQFHFILSDNLNMENMTLPPIGTREHPFIGTFKSGLKTPTGYNYDVRYTISNLTVSNVLGGGEVEKRPQSVTELNNAEVVGMFGVIGVYDLDKEATTYGDIVPSVSNFYIKDPTVRAQSSQALIGLIAGYVNGKVHNVGVEGGTLESGIDNNAAFISPSISYYALIGNKAKNVNWGGVTAPGAGTGPIKVDPNDDKLYYAMTDPTKLPADVTINGSFEDDHYVSVPDSAKDKAYVTGSNVTISNISGGAKGLHFYKTLVKSDGQAYSPTSDDSQKISGTLQPGYLPTINPLFEDNSDFYARINDIGNRTINTGAATPIFEGNGMTPVTFSDGTTLNLPSNGIWFMPSAPGKGIISFVILNNSKNARHKSIYKYQRGKNNEIINLTETKLTFAKGEFGVKHILFFEYEITDTDVSEKWEFFIGSSSTVTDDQIQFYFLALAGAGSEGSVVTPDSKELLQVNFIHSVDDIGDNVAANGMIITTFDIKLTTSDKDTESVTFTRTDMSSNASATTSGEIKADMYSHSAIVLPDTDQSG